MTNSRTVAASVFALVLVSTSGAFGALAVAFDNPAPPPAAASPPTVPDDAVGSPSPSDLPASRTVVVDAAFLERCAGAAAYADRHNGRTMLVMHRGEIVFERYASGVTDRSHFELASGTKSFTGVIAMAAVEEGLLALDDRASDTIVEWKEDDSKRDITIRQILTLTSGLGSGTVGRPPTYADAIAQPRERPTGSAFIYGPTPFQVFGEILRRKLVAAGNGETVQAYMTRRLFAPLGIEIGAWRIGRDGQPHLPSGISLSARDWAKFGEFVRNEGRVGETQVISAERIRECMRGTTVKPEYGLTWWLASFDGQGLDPEELLQRGNTRGTEPREADIWMAAGLGKQRLYVIPSMELVIVRQATLARRGGYEDRAFLGMLLDLPLAEAPTQSPRSSQANSPVNSPAKSPASAPRRGLGERLRDRLRDRP